MKFTRFERYEPITITKRKQQAFLRKQERERARYPLFPDQIEQRSLESEAERRKKSAQASETRMRDLRAKVWREARRDYWAATEEQREAIRIKWEGWRGGRDPNYFRYVVDVCTGVMEERARRMRERDRELRARIWASVDAQQAMDLAA